METEYNKEVEKMLFLIDQLQKAKNQLLEISKKISGDKKSPNLQDRIDWAKPWKAIIGPIRMPAKNFWDFEMKFILRSKGPTQYLNLVVDRLMDFPQNHNFYLRSKRCYVCRDGQWVQMKAKLFYPELRFKILMAYRNVLLRSQWGIFGSQCQSLKHWTNQLMYETFLSKQNKRSPRSSLQLRPVAPTSSSGQRSLI